MNGNFMQNANNWSICIFSLLSMFSILRNWKCLFSNDIIYWVCHFHNSWNDDLINKKMKTISFLKSVMELMFPKGFQVKPINTIILCELHSCVMQSILLNSYAFLNWLQSIDATLIRKAVFSTQIEVYLTCISGLCKLYKIHKFKMEIKRLSSIIQLHQYYRL